SNEFLRKLSNDHRGRSDDPWEIVQRLSSFTSSYIEPGAGEKNLSALGVAKFPTGDCGSYSKLLVALLRIQHIPAREVIGLAAPTSNPLLISTNSANPTLSLHGWVEVWIGRWIPIDPTFGETPAGPLHVA